MTNETKKISWNSIWKFIKSKIFIALVIIGLIVFNSIQCSRIQELERQQAIDEQNQIAMRDSLKFEKTKYGDLQVSIAGYIASEKELKDLNKDLWEKVKQQEGKVISLNRVIIQLRQDSIQLRKALIEKDKVIEKLLKIDENTYSARWTLPFKYDSTNFDVFSGKTYIGVINKDPLELAHIDTEMIARLTQIDLVWGQEIVKNQLRVFVRSAYPGFTVQSMEGVLIDPNTSPYIRDLMKKKHWFSGFGVGVGITGGFNFVTGKYGIVIGPSVHYTIYNW